MILTSLLLKDDEKEQKISVRQTVKSFKKHIEQMYSISACSMRVFYYDQVGLIDILSREGGDIGLSKCPQSFAIMFFLFVASTSLDTLIEFWFVGSFNWVSKRFNH